MAVSSVGNSTGTPFSDFGKVRRSVLARFGVAIQITSLVPRPVIGTRSVDDTTRAGARPEIWTYGNRNVQAATLHPQTGELWEVEFGPQGGDEINIARKGKNYGWATISYGVNYGPAKAPITGGETH